MYSSKGMGKQPHVVQKHASTAATEHRPPESVNRCGKMVQHLRDFAALVANPGSVPRVNMVDHNCPVTVYPRPSSVWAAHIFGTHTYMWSNI